MTDQAPRDKNFVTALLATSSTTGETVTVYADPTTHRLLVDTTGGNNASSAIIAVFDGSSSPIANGSTLYISCPFAATINAWTILVDTGTCTVKTWKVANGTAVPTVGNSISTNGVSISSGTAIRSTVLTDFTTTTIAANDIFGFNITAISNATLITFELGISRS